LVRGSDTNRTREPRRQGNAYVARRNRERRYMGGGDETAAATFERRGGFAL
jgi:hypothetical protein